MAFRCLVDGTSQLNCLRALFNFLINHQQSCIVSALFPARSRYADDRHRDDIKRVEKGDSDSVEKSNLPKIVITRDRVRLHSVAFK